MSSAKIDNVEVEAFESSEGDGRIIFKWIGNLGWGEYTLWQEDGVWYADSEHMDQGDDKEFLKKILDAFVSEIIVKG